MPWPLSQDYNEAIQTPAASFSDSDLRQGQARTNALGLPVPCSGNFADVYQIGYGTRAWAVKCFTRESPGLRERYFEISAYLRKLRLSFMVDFSFLDEGIHVRGQSYPVLKMDWVEGFTLNHFIKQNLEKPRVLQKLAPLWLELARRLREANLAHCDLQHGNLLLVPRSKAGSLAIKLVDYDGMFVPSLAGQPSGEVGHSAYQHPQRLREGTYNREVDRFPLLVIYCAIRGLIVGGRALWERYDNGDNLLFREQDLRSPRESALFWELARLPDPDVPRLADILSRAVYKPIEKTPLLEELPLNGPKPVSVTAGTLKSQETTTPTISAEVAWATAPPPATEPIREAVTKPEESAGSVFAQAMPEPSDTGKLWKERGRGTLVAALTVTLCIFLCCLGAGTLLLRGHGNKPAASNSLARSKTRLETSPKVISSQKKTEDQQGQSRQNGRLGQAGAMGGVRIPGAAPEDLEAPEANKGREKLEGSPESIGPKQGTARVHYLSENAGVKRVLVPGMIETTKKPSMGGAVSSWSKIVVGGKESPHGLSMHPYPPLTYFSLKYPLNKSATTFITSVALDDSTGKIPKPLTFQVLGDDKILWKSQPVSLSRNLQECKLDVRGIDVLELRVDCPGPNTHVNAIWIEPRVLLQDTDGKGSDAKPAVEPHTDTRPNDQTQPTGVAPSPKQKAITNSIGMKLVLIPAGKFMMDQVRPEPAEYIVSGRREVEIPRPFYMGIHEITQGQYATVMNANPSQFKEEGDSGRDLPVECVTWHEANAFCGKLSALPAEQRAGRAYRLPTEAEWEYAYRAGSRKRHYFDAHAANNYAWTNANSDGKTHPVGKLKPNAWGLYDMNGNVWEWCSDSQDGEAQVLRGSSLHNNVELLRTWSDPSRRTFDFGFRVVCVLVGGAGQVKKRAEDAPKTTKREKRQQRWVMIFNTRDGDDYARQLQGLKAILAIPVPREEAQYLVAEDLSKRPVVLKKKDIKDINRIYWIDDKPESVVSVSRSLGLNPVPSFIVAFFPEQLEQELLEKELKYRHVDEEGIEQTRFQVRRKLGGGYEPVVVDQRVTQR